MEKFLDIGKCIYSFLLTILTSILGTHWLLFALYFSLNTVDFFTGWAKSRVNGTESSVTGMKGIIKKFCYWLMILIAFLMPMIFEEIGMIIGEDFSVTLYVGWFVLVSLIINEYRSILENLVEIGCNVPPILTKGLEIISKKIEETGDENE